MIANVIGNRIWDRCGVFLSIGCAIHCFLMAVLPMLALMEPKDSCCPSEAGWGFHQWALVGVMIIATMAFAKCWRETGWVNVARLLAGVALLSAPHMVSCLADYESIFTVTGAALLAWAHWKNLRRASCACSSGDGR